MSHGETSPERICLHLRCILKHLSGIIREIPKPKTMNIIATIRSNWRDITTFLILIISCSFTADAIERYTLMDSGQTWLNNTVFVFRGLARFGTVNLAGFMFMAIGWPSVNKFSNQRFAHAWDNLPELYRFSTFIGLSAAYLIAASICFAA